MEARSGYSSKCERDRPASEFSFIDMSEAESISRELRPNTRMVWVETPSNPLLKIVDLEAVAAIAKDRSLLAIADNTFASPYLQHPLEFGFDIVVHSATKYLNGHSDIVGGVVAVSSPELGERLSFLQNAVGAIASPFDSFLVLRGLKTLHLRMERHCRTHKGWPIGLRDTLRSTV